MISIRRHNPNLSKILSEAGVILIPNSAGKEHIRYSNKHANRPDRFDRLIQETFVFPASAPGAKSAHFVAFHMILPAKVQAALGAIPYDYGGATYIDYSLEKDAPTERRELCILTVNSFGATTVAPETDWSAFLQWVRKVPGYSFASDEALLSEITADMVAWGAGTLKYPIWAHAIGVRPMQPTPKSTFARMASSLALNLPIDETTIDREVRIADMLDAMASSIFQGEDKPSPKDILLIEDALKKLSTRRGENPKDSINRWLDDLLKLRPRLETASFSTALVLNWLINIVESGTVKKWDLRHYTRRRYGVAASSEILTATHKTGTHPGTWTQPEVDAICAEIMKSKVRDKVGLGAGTSSFFHFLHDQFGTPLPTRGLHALIPEAIPRAQYISECEVQRAAGWAQEVTVESDLQLMATVEAVLAMGSKAPFRLQELLNLQMCNVTECSDGSFEVEIMPHGWHAPLKTPAAMRRVYIDKGWAAEILRNFLRMRMSQGATLENLLFGSEENGNTVYRKYTIQTLLLRFLKTTTGDSEMTFHALRHSWASDRVASILTSSKITNFDRLAHVAAEMGHVSAVSTLQFYSHFAEHALNVDITAYLRDLINLGNGAAQKYLGEKLDSTLHRWQRRYDWDTTDCVWHEVLVRTRSISFPNVTSYFELAAPNRPKIATNFVHPFHPYKVLRVLEKLKTGRHKMSQVASASNLTLSDISLISESAIDIALKFLNYSKKGRDQIGDISSVESALFALDIDLKAANRSKYKIMRNELAIPLDIPKDFTYSWMHSRRVLLMPYPVVYFFLNPHSQMQPLFMLLKSAGIESTDIEFRIPSKFDSPTETLETQSEITFEFQGVWGVTPKFNRVGYHTARRLPYLTLPGTNDPVDKVSSIRGEVGGLDALFFACAVYALCLEKKNVATRN